ncbi:MAG TPA: exo-alpha-sialidase [Bryobacteraceae bacterium]|nr:exo-alpha-sialidase [Bryobacteraceae bacterium]
MRVLRHNLGKASQANMKNPGKLTPKVGSRREGPAIARNESALLVNPLDPSHIVGVEEIALPDGTPMVSARVSFDSGSTWRESWPLPAEAGWAGVIGPVVAVDAHGNLNLAALALDPDRSRATLVLYRSEDGGIHWTHPMMVLHGATECCYSIATDLNPQSPFRGNVYVASDMENTLRLARYGDGGEAPGRLLCSGSAVPEFCFNPEVLVDAAGVVHVVWTTGVSGCSILATHSTDGAKTFTEPVTVAEGITSVHEGLPETAPATFIGADGVAICVWADDREGRSRIYCRRSADGGRTWDGPPGGEPLVHHDTSGQHEFQPHLIPTPAGEICCAFYEYGPKAPGGAQLVDLAMAVSYDRGATFSSRMVLSEQPWDPALEKPMSRAATRGALGWLALR